MERIIFSTTAPEASAWFTKYQDQVVEARRKAEEFGRRATRFLGPCVHGNDRHDVAYRASMGDSWSIVGVKADPDEHKVPDGFLLTADRVIVGDTSYAAGLRFTELAEQYSTSRLHDGLDEIGVPSRLFVNGHTRAPGLARDPNSDGTIYQFWTAAPGIRFALLAAIKRSGVEWESSTEEQLESVHASIKSLTGAAQ